MYQAQMESLKQTQDSAFPEVFSGNRPHLQTTALQHVLILLYILMHPFRFSASNKSLSGPAQYMINHRESL